MTEPGTDEGRLGYGLDELSLARLREGRALLAELLADYDGLVAAAKAAVDEVRFGEGDHDDLPAVRAVEDFDPADRFPAWSTEQLRCLLFGCGEWVAEHGGYFSVPSSCFYELGKLPLDLVAGDIRLLAAVVEPRAPLHETGDSARPIGYVVKMTARLLRQGAIGAVALADAVADQNGSVLRNLERTLEQASAGRGMSTSSLLERLTPDHGIDDSGGVSVVTEQGIWRITLDDRDGAVVAGPADQPEPVRRLRDLTEELKITQPVRQLWRETYRVSATERETALYSERYAGHVLRFNQAYGLARRRGWAGGFLSGAWDGGDSAVARRDYPRAGLRASWQIAQLEQASSDVAVELCLTERVAFSALERIAGN